MNAFLFVPLLAATWALGFVLALFAAHYFLTVLESTAAGNEHVVWPEEPLIDWFWKGFYLAFLAGVWLTPLIVFARLMSTHAWGQSVIVAGGFWLLFPIGILSSQSASSPWIPFWPGVLARFGQRMPAVFGFYVLSIPITLAVALWFRFAGMRSDSSLLVTVIVAPITAAAFLVYARALGRLGLVLSFTRGANNEPAGPSRKRMKPKPQIGEHTEQPIQKQPSELPPVETPFEGALTGYNVVFDDPPAPPTSPTTPAATGSQSASPPPAPLMADPPAHELALEDRSNRVKEPERPFDGSLVRFLFAPGSIKAWIVLSGGLALLGGMINLLRALRPA